MKIFNFFSESKDKKSQDIMSIASAILPLIDSKVNETFMAYGQKLLNEPLDYIVPAVWGAKKDGELEPDQREINKKIEPVVLSVYASLQLTKVEPAQEFAILSLIRGLIISKLIYMIEGVKFRSREKTDTDQVICRELADLEPEGHA